MNTCFIYSDSNIEYNVSLLFNSYYFQLNMDLAIIFFETEPKIKQSSKKSLFFKTSHCRNIFCRKYFLMLSGRGSNIKFPIAMSTWDKVHFKSY